MTARTFLMLAGLLGALGVTLGAFGAHGLPKWLEKLAVPEAEIPERIEWFDTATRYHLYHALAMLGLAAIGEHWNRGFTVAAISWTIGVLVFSGCLYAMTVTGIRILGAIVPIGGLAFIIGWISVIFAAFAIKR